MDIRERPYLTQEDISRIPFISHSLYRYRPYYRQGLRSHIIGVYHPKDIHLEQHGIQHEGIRLFPPAKPRHMFRIFRNKGSIDRFSAELRDVKTLERYLLPDHLAKSDEFLVSYQKDVLLCGIQRYIDGNIFGDLWGSIPESVAYDHMLPHMDSVSKRSYFRSQVRSFVLKVKTMVRESGVIPDLGGKGNLILAHDGRIVLVDVNNVCRVSEDASIPIDDHGYPSLDLSIQGLGHLEQKCLGSIDLAEPLYKTFLDPVRVNEAKRIAEHQSLTSLG